MHNVAQAAAFRKEYVVDARRCFRESEWLASVMERHDMCTSRYSECLCNSQVPPPKPELLLALPTKLVVPSHRCEFKSSPPRRRVSERAFYVVYSVKDIFKANWIDVTRKTCRISPVYSKARCLRD